MSKRIKYNRNVSSVAMSKWPYQSGINFSKERNNVIRIQAINPKMDSITSHLHMEIPYENLNEVIGALIELKKD